MDTKEILDNHPVVEKTPSYTGGQDLDFQEIKSVHSDASSASNNIYELYMSRVSCSFAKQICTGMRLMVKRMLI
jgi:hypothetical protein